MYETMNQDPELRAAIDVGTNTALLLIARTTSAGALEIVEDHCLTPRLGSGVAARGLLDPAAMQRTIEALSVFAAHLRARGVTPDRVRAVGTAVFRRASDAAAFVERARAATGISIEIISPEEEARLGEVAVAAEGVGPETLVVDVGGGSTEIACRALALRHSVPIGAVVLTETFLSDAPLHPGGWSALTRAVHEACRAFPADIGAVRPVIALGGSAVNLGSLALGLERFDHERAEGAEFDASLASSFAVRLARLPVEARRQFAIEPDRAEILPAGLACLAGVFARTGAHRVRVTGRGLRFGVLRELLRAR
jgi:exopolyphosphatase / guanosine-5'-triphosphate,3'-diphosphate pyrophosphatase